MSRTQPKPAVKQQTSRFIRLERIPTPGRSGKLVITQDGERITYLLTRLTSEVVGVAYQLDKIETKTSEDGRQTDLRVSERYHVLLAGLQSECDCKWGVYGGYKKPCRHVAGLRKLIADGKLS